MSLKRWIRKAALTLGLAALSCTAAFGADGRSYPVEVGPVAWQRDLDGALKSSKRTGKPVFAFFQEVPGCSGCRTFGKDVMAHPLLVAAVEEAFTPVLIFNNRDGQDAKVLKRFGEPSWNYQVIRFLDAKGKDLIPRKDRVWTLHALSKRMIEALRTASRDIPVYLQVLAQESDEEHHAKAAFSQHCFWTGEHELGRIPGVVTTEAGFLDGKEVTLITYHEGVITLDELVIEARKTKSAEGLYLPPGVTVAPRVRANLPVGRLDRSYRIAPASDQKRQIRGSALGRLALSPMQATKLNAFAPLDRQRALAYLTPGQGEAMKIEQ